MSLSTITDNVAPVLPELGHPSENRADLEESAVAGYRAGELSLFEVRQLLGFDNRWETEEWLGSRGVDWNYSMEDLKDDRETIEQLLKD